MLSSLVGGRGARPPRHSSSSARHHADDDEENAAGLLNKTYPRATTLYATFLPAHAERRSLAAWLHSACCAGFSIGLNLLLVLFLLWARSQPSHSQCAIQAANAPAPSTPFAVTAPVSKSTEPLPPLTPTEFQSIPPPTAKSPPPPQKPTIAPVVLFTTAASFSSVDEFQQLFDVAKDHRATWVYCDKDFALMAGVDYNASALGVPPTRFCREHLTNEQLYQLKWFGGHVLHGFASPRRFVPPFLDCIHLPPADYRWPTKHAELPTTNPAGAVHWPNLRVRAHTELVEFNRATPKNLFHFDAPLYDRDGLSEMSLAARYIPLGAKVRNMFDIGAGGGSLGVLLAAKYGISTIASAFADWPYCEYMTERGELCLLIDVMEAMPFAKFSFDLIHISWVYHGQPPNELWDFIHEIDRILRPGGYLLMRGGWSHSQITAQRTILADLGYALLYDSVQEKPPPVTAKVAFGPDLPYHADWVAILVKPIAAAAAHADQAGCATTTRTSRTRPHTPATHTTNRQTQTHT